MPWPATVVQSKGGVSHKGQLGQVSVLHRVFRQTTAQRQRTQETCRAANFSFSVLSLMLKIQVKSNGALRSGRKASLHMQLRLYKAHISQSYFTNHI